jgi:hypothetical protein
VKIPFKKKSLLGKVTAILLVCILAKFCPKKTLVTISLNKKVAVLHHQNGDSFLEKCESYWDMLYIYIFVHKNIH